MKKTNFIKRLTDISQEAIDFIKKSVEEGKVIRLFTDKEAEENDNIIYEMPDVTFIDGYNDCEYAVVAVSKNNSGTIFHLEGKGEMEGAKVNVFPSSDKEVLFSEDGVTYLIDDNALCFLADLISKKL